MNRYGLAGLALGLLAPTALANGGETDKDVDLSAAQEEMVNIKVTPGAGITFDGGDSFSLNLSGGLIFRYDYIANDNTLGATTPINNFDVRSARIMMTGHIFDQKTRYNFSIEAANDVYFPANNLVPVKDAYVERDVNQLESMKIMVALGQMRTGHGRETNGTEFGKAMGEFTLAGRSFSGQRSRGISASIVDNDDKWRVNVGLWNRDQAGGSGFAGEDLPNGDNELSYSLNFRFDPAGSMGDSSFTTLDLARSEAFLWGVGGGLWFGNETAGGVDMEQLQYNINFAFKTKGIGGLFEFYGSSQESQAPGSQSVDDTGWSAIVNYSLDNGWTFGGQISSVDNDVSTAANRGIRANTVGVNAYAGEGTAMEYGVFVAHEYNNMATHRVIMELMGQNIDPQGGQSDTNILLRATYVLVF